MWEACLLRGHGPSYSLPLAWHELNCSPPREASQGRTVPTCVCFGLPSSHQWHVPWRPGLDTGDLRSHCTAPRLTVLGLLRAGSLVLATSVPSGQERGHRTPSCCGGSGKALLGEEPPSLTPAAPPRRLQQAGVTAARAQLPRDWPQPWEHPDPRGSGH